VFILQQHRVIKHRVESQTIDYMHESTKRLLDFARAVTADEPTPVRDFADLQVRMDISSGVMSNWKRRGVSKDGAISAEQIFGCSVQWILEGIESPNADRATLKELAPVYSSAIPDLPTTLRHLTRHLASADDLTRHGIAPLLSRLVMEPAEAASIAHMITAMLAARLKRAS